MEDHVAPFTLALTNTEMHATSGTDATGIAEFRLQWRANRRISRTRVKRTFFRLLHQALGLGDDALRVKTLERDLRRGKKTRMSDQRQNATAMQPAKPTHLLAETTTALLRGTHIRVTVLGCE